MDAGVEMFLLCIVLPAMIVAAIVQHVMAPQLGFLVMLVPIVLIIPLLVVYAGRRLNARNHR